MKSRPAVVHSQRADGLVHGHKGYVVQQHQATPNSHIQAEEGGGGTIPDPSFLLIGALESQQTPFNGYPDDLLDTLAYWLPH